MHKKCAIYHILLNIKAIDDFSSRISTNFCTITVENFFATFFVAGVAGNLKNTDTN